MADYSTHQPFLKYYIQHTFGDILEFGTGDGSTGFILDLIKDTNRRLISIENNKEWYDKMTNLYPPTSRHIYHFVDDYKTFTLPKNVSGIPYSVVFIDSSPWESRIKAMNQFKNDAEYIIIHDVDYFPNNGLFGKIVKNDIVPTFDFSDISNNYQLYYPKKPWPAPTGPPTLVFSNIGKDINNTINY